MFLNRENYESGHYAGEAAFLTNPTTLKLESDATGLWIYADAKKAFPELKLPGNNEKVVIEMFNCHGYSDDYNESVIKFADVMSCVHNNVNVLNFYNCVISKFVGKEIHLVGRITMETRNSDNTTHTIANFKHAKIINANNYFYTHKPLNAKVDCLLTMNSSVIYPSFTIDELEFTKDGKLVNKRPETPRKVSFYERLFNLWSSRFFYTLWKITKKQKDVQEKDYAGFESEDADDETAAAGLLKSVAFFLADPITNLKNATAAALVWKADTINFSSAVHLE